jgi:hypothetical protein
MSVNIPLPVRFKIIGDLFSHEVSLFRDYFQKVRIHFSSEHLEIQEEFRRKLVDDTETSERVLLEQYERAILYHTEEFPGILRSSFYTATYSHFERSLFFLCDITKRLKKFPFKPKEIMGKGINQARQYLSKVAEINMGPYSDTWERIQFYAEIRNKIVHNGGELDPNQDKDLIAKFKKYGNFALDPNFNVALTDDACLEALFYYEKFLGNTILELTSKFNPSKT